MNERMTAQLRIIKAMVNTLDAADFSTAYFDRRPDGSSIQLLGR